MARRYRWGDSLILTLYLNLSLSRRSGGAVARRAGSANLHRAVKWRIMDAVVSTGPLGKYCLSFSELSFYTLISSRVNVATS